MNQFVLSAGNTQVAPQTNAVTPTYPPAMLEEYKTLRQEILNLQANSYQILTHALSVSGAAAVFAAQDPAKIGVLAKAVVLIAAVVVLSTFFYAQVHRRRKMHRIGRYIEYVVETQVPGLSWETAWSRLTDKRTGDTAPTYEAAPIFAMQTAGFVGAAFCVAEQLKLSPNCTPQICSIGGHNIPVGFDVFVLLAALLYGLLAIGQWYLVNSANGSVFDEMAYYQSATAREAAKAANSAFTGNRKSLIPLLVTDARNNAGNQHGALCCHELGWLLHDLTRTVEHGYVGEIGTGTGVSTAWMIEALPKSSEFYTIDSSSIAKGKAEKLFLGRERIHVEEGHWETWLDKYNAKFNLLFVDVDIEHISNPSRLEQVVKLLDVGGVAVFTLPLQKDGELSSAFQKSQRAWKANPSLSVSEVLLNRGHKAVLATRLAGDTLPSFSQWFVTLAQFRSRLTQDEAHAVNKTGEELPEQRDATENTFFSTSKSEYHTSGEESAELPVKFKMD